MWMAMTIGWVLSDNDAEAAQQATDIISNIAAYPKIIYPGMKNSNYKAGNLLQEEYSPTVFMNDASADQKVLQGYGDATYQRLKAIQNEVDPIGFFPTRTGGFKLT
jgi:protein-disulfide isomerase